MRAMPRCFVASRVRWMIAGGLAASPAWAHLPHDEVTAAAIPTRTADGRPWWVVVHGVPFVSTDRGETWDAAGGDPMDTDLVAGAVTDGAVVAFAGGGVLWWSEDGVSWGSVPFASPVRGLAAVGDHVVVAAADGLWVAPAGGEPVPTDIATGALAIASDGEAVTAVLEDGRIAVGDADGFELTDGPGGDVRVAVSHAGTTWAGDGDGRVWRRDGDAWAACGSLPPLDHPAIVAIAAADGRLIVAPASRAPFVSDDGCATWADRNHGQDTAFGTNGGPADDAAAFRVVGADGDRLWVAGWSGVSWSEDGGASWEEADVLPPDYARGARFSPDFSVDRTIWLGGYGAGVVRTEDAGATFFADNHGLLDVNAEEIDAGGVGVWAVVNHDPWLSRDGGATWRPLAGNLGADAISTVAVLGDGAPFVTGLAGDVAAAWIGDPYGYVWARADGLSAATAGLAGAPVAWRGPGSPRAVCVAARVPAEIVCTENLVAWEVVATGDPDDGFVGLVAWPPDAPEALLWGDAGGVWRWPLAGEAERVADGAVTAAAVTDDGTVFVGRRDGRLLRSDDGGVTFTTLDARLPAPAAALAPRPGFAAHPDVLAATVAGVFHVADDVATRWGPQAVDDRSGYLRADCGEAVIDADAALSRVVRLPPGCTAWTRVRGTAITVTGSVPRAGRARVRIDDTVVCDEGRRVDHDVICAADDLADAWHHVAIEADGDAIDVDVVLAASGAPALAADPRPCGCAAAGGPGGALAAALVAAALAVRRRR